MSGDIAAVGIEDIGIKSGLINNNGNLIKICKIIVFPGFLVGGAEIIKLKLENTRADIIIAVIIRKKLIVNPLDRKVTPKINGTDENNKPYINEPQILPNNIVLIEIGHVVNRSKVPRIVSQGKIIGPNEVEVKKRTIAIIPEMR